MCFLCAVKCVLFTVRRGHLEAASVLHNDSGSFTDLLNRDFSVLYHRSMHAAQPLVAKAWRAHCLQYAMLLCLSQAYCQRLLIEFIGWKQTRRLRPLQKVSSVILAGYFTDYWSLQEHTDNKPKLGLHYELERLNNWLCSIFCLNVILN